MKISAFSQSNPGNYNPVVVRRAELYTALQLESLEGDSIRASQGYP